MNIALIVHFTPQNPEGGQGRGPCSVKAVRWREAKNKKRQVKRVKNPATGKKEKRGEEIGRKKRWGGRCVCVLTFCRHSEKTGSSFQTPVQAIEWVSSVKESDTEFESSVFQVFHCQEEPPPPSSLLSDSNLASWLGGLVGLQWWRQASEK